MGGGSAWTGLRCSLHGLYKGVRSEQTRELKGTGTFLAIGDSIGISIDVTVDVPAGTVLYLFIYRRTHVEMW